MQTCINCHSVYRVGESAGVTCRRSGVALSSGADMGTDDGHCGSTVIDKAFLAGLVALTHGTFFATRASDGSCHRSASSCNNGSDTFRVTSPSAVVWSSLMAPTLTLVLAFIYRIDGTPRRLLDIEKINKLGWSPSVSLVEGITKTYRWYVRNLGTF